MADYGELLAALDAYAEGRLRPVLGLDCAAAALAIRALIEGRDRYKAALWFYAFGKDDTGSRARAALRELK